MIHSYVCVSMSLSSLIGSLYYESVIDYFSRKNLICFKTKDEVLNEFTKFKSLVEN
jgi:hypothetical protein